MEAPARSWPEAAANGAVKPQFASHHLMGRAVQTRHRPNHGRLAYIQVNQKKIFINEATKFPPLPDRLSVDTRSPHHVAVVFEHDVGIRLNDKERLDVEEYCLSEGWVKMPAGKTLDRKGHPLLIKLKGKVELFYRKAGNILSACRRKVSQQ